jgi:hypothetical protein
MQELCGKCLLITYNEEGSEEGISVVPVRSGYQRWGAERSRTHFVRIYESMK